MSFVSTKEIAAAGWFGATGLPVFWLRVLNRYFDRGRGNGFAPPLRHRQGELGAANADLFGDPHGVVKEDRSAPTFQDVPGSRHPLLPAWVLDLGHDLEVG
jgi:hypothetical protein